MRSFALVGCALAMFLSQSHFLLGAPVFIDGIDIDINETKSKDGSVSFSLGQVGFFPDCAGSLANEYDPKTEPSAWQPYRLNVYKTENGKQKLFKTYMMFSGRSVLRLDEAKDGSISTKVEEEKFGVITVVIEYDAKITHIGIVANGKETRFKLTPPKRKVDH